MKHLREVDEIRYNGKVCYHNLFWIYPQQQKMFSFLEVVVEETRSSVLKFHKTVDAWDTDMTGSNKVLSKLNG